MNILALIVGIVLYLAIVAAIARFLSITNDHEENHMLSAREQAAIAAIDEAVRTLPDCDGKPGQQMTLTDDQICDVAWVKVRLTKALARIAAMPETGENQ